MGLQGRLRKGWGFARLGAWLAVCALAVRILIPAGYMPGPAQGGGLPTLVICTAQGAKAVVIDATDKIVEDKAPLHKDGKTKTDHPCMFAGQGAPLIAEIATLAAQPATYALATGDAKLVHQRPGHGLAAPPPPKTGPPSIT